MKISELKPLEKNPFKSKGDDQIRQIADSIQNFEKMMAIRPIIYDETNVILGGNKRFFALKMLGYKDIPETWAKQVLDLTEEEKREFIVKDNAHWGSVWDYDLLTEWNVDLSEWGVDDVKIQKNEEFEKQMGEIETVQIRPFTKTHVLLSFEPEIMIEIKENLQAIKDITGVEYEQSSN